MLGIKDESIKERNTKKGGRVQTFKQKKNSISHIVIVYRY